MLVCFHDQEARDRFRTAQGPAGDYKGPGIGEEPPFLGPADVYAWGWHRGPGRADGDLEPSLPRDARRRRDEETPVLRGRSGPFLGEGGAHPARPAGLRTSGEAACGAGRT